MDKYEPKSVTVFPWLQANLGEDCLNALCGTDTAALRAAADIIALYNRADSEHDQALFSAFGAVVNTMQPHTQELAYHAIAETLDWRNRAQIWKAAGLPDIRPRRCVNE